MKSLSKFKALIVRHPMASVSTTTMLSAMATMPPSTITISAI